jgi:flagellar basal body-associated protein FliL
MSEGSWLAHQKKRNNFLWIIIIMVSTLIAAGIFLRNNSDLLWGSKNEKKEGRGFAVGSEEPEKKEPFAVSAEKEPSLKAFSEVQPVSKKTFTPGIASAPAQSAFTQATTDVKGLLEKEPLTTKPIVKQGRAPKEAASPSVPAQPEAQQMQAEIGTTSLLLSDIKCVLMDRKKPTLLLSLELYFGDNEALKKEILLKRDNLKVMVKKALVSKSLDDLVVETLRVELKKAINALLEKGKVLDIEFREFRLDKVE